MFLHREEFAVQSLYAEVLTQRSLYTEQLLHDDADADADADDDDEDEDEDDDEDEDEVEQLMLAAVLWEKPFAGNFGKKQRLSLSCHYFWHTPKL